MPSDLKIDKLKTALVVIDLQKGIVGMETKPHDAAKVVANTAKLAGAFRKSGMPVCLVRVALASDGADALKPVTDAAPMSFPRDAGWSEIVPELGPEPDDIVITKRQWGAFYGTPLDLLLRRRGITTIVLCGIATDFGVESTARFAYEYGYQQIFAEDATAARSGEEHDHVMKFIFTRLGKIRSTDAIMAALE